FLQSICQPATVGGERGTNPHNLYCVPNAAASLAESSQFCPRRALLVVGADDCDHNLGAWSFIPFPLAAHLRFCSPHENREPVVPICLAGRDRFACADARLAARLSTLLWR